MRYAQECATGGSHMLSMGCGPAELSESRVLPSLREMRMGGRGQEGLRPRGVSEGTGGARQRLGTEEMRSEVQVAGEGDVGDPRHRCEEAGTVPAALELRDRIGRVPS